MTVALIVAFCGAAIPSASATAATGVPLRFSTQVLDAATIRDEQSAVVNRNDQVPIREATVLVGLYQSNVSRDRQAISDDAAAQSSASQGHQVATTHLAADTDALDRAERGVAAAVLQVNGDRSRLGALAVGTYTGAFTNPQPSGSPAPQAEQQAAIDVAEVSVVAGIVDRRLKSDLASVATDTRVRDLLTSAVAADGQQISATAQEESAASTRLVADNAALLSDQRGLPAAQAQLNAAEAALKSDLASVAGPATGPAGSISLLGGSALTASQLASWYHRAGYSNFTSASIEQLAAWYVQAGVEEGVRGDLAFAQAMLETGGFSSPDAVDLNNYAGIGHCDSCASGWQFPSPNGGVVGQVQLLRIFATTVAPPAGAPGPVLPSLTVSAQHEAGCCPTVESLTGVWATDPTYDSQILSIYQQMLGYALSPS